MITTAKAKAGIGDELHFHDLRGTAATNSIPPDYRCG